MSTEIERKFLVIANAWHPDPARGKHYRQGYLSRDPERIVRVRAAGDEGFLTIKGATHGIARTEFEYPISLADAEFMLASLCLQPIIEKVRYREPWEGHTWEVDVFEGVNRGLIVAEIELPSADAAFIKPPWVGREVSADPRYFNAALITHPFSAWSDRD